MAIPKELLDELMKHYKKPEDLIGENGILKELTKSLVERALQGEMTDHLGYDKHSVAGNNTGNSRNGTSAKTLKTTKGDLRIEVPRDRNGDFDPKLVAKNQTHFDGFDEQILSMYAKGMSTREISEHIRDLYHTEVSTEFISRVTDSVLEVSGVTIKRQRGHDKTTRGGTLGKHYRSGVGTLSRAADGSGLRPSFL